MLYAYPKEVSIEQYVGEDDAYEGRRTSILPNCSDRWCESELYFQQCISYFIPTTLSNTDETTFEFEVSIQKDNNGRFFEVQKIIE